MPALLKATEELAKFRRGGGNLATGDSWEERKYAVYFVDYTATSLDARNATGVPVWGVALTGYSLFCMEKNAECDPSDQTIWYVTVTFRTLSAPDKIPNPDTSGTSHKWQIIKTIVPQPVEVPVQQDINGKTAVNCIGEPFDPPITVVVYDHQINVSYLTDLIDQAAIDSCQDHVNLSTVFFTIGGTTLIIPAGELLFQNAPIQEDYDADGNTITKVDLQFARRIGGWHENRPNLSLNMSSGFAGITSGVSIVSIIDATGTQPVTEPRYLDGFGAPIPAGGTITMNSFATKKSFDFSGLLSEIT